MKVWPVKINDPKYGECEIRESTDKETLAANRRGLNYAPRSHGFVNLFQRGKFVAWCGVAYAKRLILNKHNQKLPKYIEEVPI
jgi:hypothetical protein